MFAVIYRGFVYPEKEIEYINLWEQVARYFVEHRGALGSTLHKMGLCEYLAYSKWPDRNMRDASWGDSAKDLPQDVHELIQQLKACVDRTQPYEEICMKVMSKI